MGWPDPKAGTIVCPTVSSQSRVVAEDRVPWVLTRRALSVRFPPLGLRFCTCGMGRAIPSSLGRSQDWNPSCLTPAPRPPRSFCLLHAPLLPGGLCPSPGSPSPLPSPLPSLWGCHSVCAHTTHSFLTMALGGGRAMMSPLQKQKQPRREGARSVQSHPAGPRRAKQTSGSV